MYLLSGVVQLTGAPHNHPVDQKCAEVKNRLMLSQLAQTSELTPSSIVEGLGLAEHENSERYKKYIINMRRKLRTRKGKKTESPTAPIVTSDYWLIPSKKQDLVMHDGFVYRKYNTHRDKTKIYLRCTMTTCPARANISNNQLILTKWQHSHPADVKMDQSQLELLVEAAEDVTRPMVEIFAQFNVVDVHTRRFLQSIRKELCLKLEEQVPIEQEKITPEKAKKLKKPQPEELPSQSNKFAVEALVSTVDEKVNLRQTNRKEVPAASSSSSALKETSVVRVTEVGLKEKDMFLLGHAGKMLPQKSVSMKDCDKTRSKKLQELYSTVDEKVNLRHANRNEVSGPSSSSSALKETSAFRGTESRWKEKDMLISGHAGKILPQKSMTVEECDETSPKKLQEITYSLEALLGNVDDDLL